MLIQPFRGVWATAPVVLGWKGAGAVPRGSTEESDDRLDSRASRSLLFFVVIALQTFQAMRCFGIRWGSPLDELFAFTKWVACAPSARTAPLPGEV